MFADQHRVRLPKSAVKTLCRALIGVLNWSGPRESLAAVRDAQRVLGGTEGEIKIDLLDEDGQHYGRITFRTWDPKES